MHNVSCQWLCAVVAAQRPRYIESRYCVTDILCVAYATCFFKHFVYTFVVRCLRRHLLYSHRALTKRHLMTTTVSTCCLCLQEVENQVTLAHHMNATDKPHTRVANEVLSQVNESILSNLARSFKTFKWCVT